MAKTLSEEQKRNLKVNIKRIPEWQQQIDEIKREFSCYDLSFVAQSASLLWKLGDACLFIGESDHSKDRDRFYNWTKSLSITSLIYFWEFAPHFLTRYAKNPIEVIETIEKRYNKYVHDFNEIENSETTMSVIVSIFTSKIHIDNWLERMRYLKEQIAIFSQLMSERDNIVAAIRTFADIREKSFRVIPKMLHAQKWLSLAQEKKAAIERFEKKHGNAFAKAAAIDKITRSRATSLKRLVKKTKICPYCGNKLDKNPHLDHIYPVAKGGLSIVENLVWCCDACNALKSDKGLIQFLSERGVELGIALRRLKALDKHI